MTTKICDRCGAEIREFPWQAMTFPAYSIVKVETRMDFAVSVDLCRKCQDALTQWLKSEQEENDIVEVKNVSMKEFERMKKK